MWNSNSFSLRGKFSCGKKEAQSSVLSISYGEGTDTRKRRKKVAKHDGELVEKLSQLRDYFITLIFTPDDMSLLKGGPSERRDFLDRILTLIHDTYLETLKEYNKIRRQRNSILKRPDPDEVLLEQYDETLIAQGETIIRKRRDLVPDIEEHLRDHAGLILETDPESIQINYDPDTSAKNIASNLKSSRQTDLKRGHTTRGPHRDDWMVKIEDRPVDRFASQGELRALLLALKVCANSVIINRISEVPVLLLDDLESELDTTRKERVLTLLHRCPSQVIITGTGGLTGDLLGESSDRIISLEAR